MTEHLIEPTLWLMIIGLTVLALTCGILGYQAAIYQSRHVRRLMNEQVTELELRIATLNIEIATDPERAWIDHGQRYVLHQIENSLRDIRTRMQRN